MPWLIPVILVVAGGALWALFASEPGTLTPAKRKPLDVKPIPGGPDMGAPAWYDKTDLPDWRKTQWDGESDILIAWKGILYPIRHGARSPEADDGRKEDDMFGQTMKIDDQGFGNWYWVPA